MEDAAGAADDLGGGAGGAADKLGDAAKNAKKLAGNLQEFDYLNVVTSPSDSGGSGGSGGGGGSGAGNYGEWVQGESILDHFKSDIDNLYELGEYIGETLTSAMNNIDWDKIYGKARGFGKGLADFLNGLISPELFDATGRTIAGALNTALHFLDSFGTTFDWKDFGNSIAAGINGFFKKFDFKLLAKTLNVWTKGILDTMITAVGKTRWDKIGQKIGIFLYEIDFLEIGSKIGVLIWKAINAGIDLWNGMFSAAPIETTLLSVLAALKISSITIMGIDSARKAIDGVRVGLMNIAKLAISHPLIAIGAGLSAIGIGLYNMEKNWKKEMADQFMDFQKEIGSAAPEIQKSADALHDMAEKTGEILSTANEDSKKLDSLADAYFKLADKTELTKKEQEKLKEYSQKLIEQCPILKKSIDEVTGRYTAQKTEIEKLITAQQEYRKMAAYEEVIGQYETAQQKANIQMEMANIQYENNEKAIGGLNDAMDSLVESGMDKNIWAEQNKDLLGKLGVAYEEGSFDVADLAKQISFYEKENQELVISQKDLSKELDKSNKELEVAKVAYENHKNAADEAKKSSVSFQQALSNLQTDLSNLDITLADGFMENLVIQGYDSSGLVDFFSALKEGTAVNADELKTMFSSLGLTLPSEIATALESKSSDVQSSASKTLLSISSGVQAREPELTKLFEDLGINLPDSLTKNLATKEASLQKTTVELLSMLENGYKLKEENLLVLFENLGLNVPDKMLSSLGSKEVETQQAAINLLGQIAKGYNGSATELLNEFEKLGLDLPNNLKSALESEKDNVRQQVVDILGQILTAEESERPELIRRLDALGVDASGALNAGIESNNETIKTTSETMVQNVKTPVENEFASATSGFMYDSGANASKGFWQGMKDWWDDSWLGRKVNELKQTITGKDGLDEHSPSRILGQYGAYAGIGFNDRFKEEMDKTVPMTEKWLESLRSAFSGYSIAIPGSGMTYTVETRMLKSIDASISVNTPDSLSGSFGMNLTADITSSLKDANSDIVHKLDRVAELLEIVASKDLTIGEREVFDAVRSEDRKRYKQTGRPSWAGI